MIYTCYDMIRDCRANRHQGWSYFVSQYVPLMRRLAAHYYPAQQGRLGEVIAALRRPDSSLFENLDPAPERWFVAELRQRALAAFEEFEASAPPEPELDLETLQRALEPHTLIEKQAAWLETMRYTPEQTGVLLRMDPRTVEKVREKAAERLRGQMDSWRRSLLADNGPQLGRAAASSGTAECLTAKVFLDVLDGRATWRGREEIERHVTACWHCIDHFCRLAEVIELLRGLKPLPESEGEPLRASLGIASPRKRGWKRWLSGN